MSFPLQPLSLPFVAAAPAQWPTHAMALGSASRRLRVLLVCGLAREGQAAGADPGRAQRLVARARAVFDAAGVQSDVLDVSRLAADGGRCLQPCEDCAADGVLILLPAHWRRMSTVLQMMFDRGMGRSAPGLDEDTAERAAAGRPGRAYGLVVDGDLPRSLQVRRILCDWLDWMGLIDACEQARLAHFLGFDEPACPGGMPPDGEAALEDETRAAATALVHALTEIRAGRLDPGCPLLARAGRSSMSKADLGRALRR